MKEYKLSQETVNIIHELLDMALKSGGIKNKPFVDKVLSEIPCEVQKTQLKEIKNG